MSVQVQIQVCRACLKPSEATKLIEFEVDSEIITNYIDLLNSEVNVNIDFFSCEN